MKLTPITKVVIVFAITGLAIFGLYKFFPSKGGSAVTISDSTSVVKSDSIKITDIKVVDVTTTVDSVKVAPVVVKPTVKKKEVVKSKTTKSTKKVVKPKEDANQGNDFVPEY